MSTSVADERRRVFCVNEEGDGAGSTDEPRQWNVEARFEFRRMLGKGAYSRVIRAFDHERGQNVAIKKTSKSLFSDLHFARRIYREIRLLRHFQFDMSVVDLVHIVRPQSLLRFDDMYLVMEEMRTPLSRALRDYNQLHIHWWMYQLCRGLYRLHSAGVLHRDIKPENLLLNDESTLKIADLGLARGFDDTMGLSAHSMYVVTRNYRAPELCLGDRSYTTAVDVFSAGVIMLELYARRVLLVGQNAMEHLRLILHLTGTPTLDDFTGGCDTKCRDVILRAPPITAANLLDLCHHPNLTPSPEALDLIRRMLMFDPRKRITMEEALHHPYFADIEDSPVPPALPFDTSFERVPLHEAAYRALFLRELAHFHPNLVDDVIDELLQNEQQSLTFDPRLWPEFMERGVGRIPPDRLRPPPLADDHANSALPSPDDWDDDQLDIVECVLLDDDDDDDHGYSGGDGAAASTTTTTTTTSSSSSNVDLQTR